MNSTPRPAAATPPRPLGRPCFVCGRPLKGEEYLHTLWEFPEGSDRDQPVCSRKCVIEAKQRYAREFEGRDPASDF